MLFHTEHEKVYLQLHHWITRLSDRMRKELLNNKINNTVLTLLNAHDINLISFCSNAENK